MSLLLLPESSDLYISSDSSITLSPSSPLIPVETFTTTISTDPEIEIKFPVVKLAYNDVDITHDNYILQQKITKYLLYRILDKWLYEDELCSVLKYFKVSGDKVSVIKNKKDIDSNKICNDSEEDIEKKATYIEENILGMEQMRHLLTKITNEVGIKWYALVENEPIIVHYTKKFIKNKLKLS